MMPPNERDVKFKKFMDVLREISKHDDAVSQWQTVFKIFPDFIDEIYDEGLKEGKRLKEKEMLEKLN